MGGERLAAAGMRRREFLALPAGLAIGPEVRLIAHRGGVVDERRRENSAGAIGEAVARGYWMVELDVRRSRDGEPMLHHDETLGKAFGDGRRVEELTRREMKALAGGGPVHFEEACWLCGGKARIMLDLKGRDWPAEFYRRLWRTMEAAKVPGPVYSLGGARVYPLFEGRVMVSANRQDLRRYAEAGEPVGQRYFLFELGSEVDGAAVTLCREVGVTPVAAINTFRYTMAKRDEWAGPAEDVRRLRALGVRDFQVDSRYEALFG